MAKTVTHGSGFPKLLPAEDIRAISFGVITLEIKISWM